MSGARAGSVVCKVKSLTGAGNFINDGLMPSSVPVIHDSEPRFSKNQNPETNFPKKFAAVFNAIFSLLV